MPPAHVRPRRRERTFRWLLVFALAITGLAATTRTSGAEGSSESLDALQSRLQQLVEDYPVAGEYAVVITDLQTGETVSVNGQRRQLSACSINLVVILRATLDVDSRRTSLAAVDDLIAKTIYSSNPVTARDLYRITGRGDVLEGLRRSAVLMEQIGLADSVLDHPPGYGRESLGVDRNNWLTAEETNQILEWIWNTEEIDPVWRTYLLDRLTGVKPGLNYLMAALPSGAQVSHKNGFFRATDGTYVDNDIAIVRFQRGDTEYAYAISFFSQWVPTKYGDIRLGQSVARETWAFFNARYGEDER